MMVSPWDYRTQVPSFGNEDKDFVEVVVGQRGERVALEERHGPEGGSACARSTKRMRPRVRTSKLRHQTRKPIWKL